MHSLSATVGIRLAGGVITLRLAPAANRHEREALARLLREVSVWDLTLPDDAQQRPLRFELQPS